MLKKLKKRGPKFLLAYVACSVLYSIFEYAYMPWLVYVCGWWMFIPLYPSILLTNLAGVYLYDLLGEDVLFVEAGSSWLFSDSSSHEIERLKGYLRKSETKIFIALSIWPSPIAGYLFVRKGKKESAIRVLRFIAIGSIYCTIVWGGLLGLLWAVVIRLFK